MQGNTNHSISTGWILTATVVVILLLPAWLQEGMFVDGVTYAAISKNLAHGIGTFWQPHYTSIKYPEFNEHPPMVFGIQSLFFRVFGDGFLTERIYCFVTALAGGFGLIACYRALTPSGDVLKKAWLPVLLWVTVPVVFWSLRNNILENTLNVFTLFAVYFFSKATQHRNYFYYLNGAVCVVSAFFCKGLVGLFPLAVPFFYLFIFQPRLTFSTILKSSAPFLITGALLALIFVIVPASYENITRYLHQQLIPALQDKREITAGSHFEILGWLLLQLAAPILLTAGVLLLNSKQRHRYLSHSKSAFFFLLIGLSASLPLMITLKQRTFYLYPALPFFILAACVILDKAIDDFVVILKPGFIKWARIALLLLLALACIYSVTQYRSFARDEVMIQDVRTLSKKVAQGTTLGCNEAMQFDWPLVAYCSREGNLSLEGNVLHKYYLLDGKESVTEEMKVRYVNVVLPLRRYTLMERIDTIEIQK